MHQNWNKIEALIQKLDPRAVGRFLVRNGYTLIGSGGQASAYRGRNDDLLIVPAIKDLSDYTRRMAEILEIFATDGLTFDDVITLIALPEMDVLRYSIDTPDSVWGHLRLGYSYEAMHALFDVLKYSAAGVSTALTDYRNVSDDAQAYAKMCRFGQTELGSFVLKVYCPTRPVPVQDPATEPFGRTSTKSTVENFMFIASEQSADPSQPLPPTLNRQVASAVNRLKPDSDFGSSYLAVRYLPVVEPEPAAVTPLLQPKVMDEPQQVLFDLGPLVYNRAQSIRDRLKRAEQYGRELVSGYITDLHKDRPTTKNEQSRQISLDVKYGSGFRKVTLRLLPAEYRQAVAWHDNDQQVRLDAVFDKRGRPWSVSQLFDLSPMPVTSVQGVLFMNPPHRENTGSKPPVEPPISKEVIENDSSREDSEG